MAAQPEFTERPRDRAAGAPGERPHESIGGLLTRLLHDITGLLRNEVALARMELTEAADNTKRGLAGVAAGGAIAFAGFLALLAAAILGLSIVMEPWLAALVVGAVVAIVGFAMLQSARKKLSPDAFRMERTQESLRKDAAVARRNV